jgi:hypothetical protein
MMACYVESALFGRDMARNERNRHVHVEQHAALQTMHMVVPVDATVIATRLISERQLLDETVLSQEMKCSVDRAIGDPRVMTPDPFEDLAGRQMSLRRTNFEQNFGPLRRVFEPGSDH